MTPRLPPAISGSVMRLSAHGPFFSVLALHAVWVEDDTIATACTDGKKIWFNADYVQSLIPVHRDFLVAHEVMHVALRHVRRIGDRDPDIWNHAADIVINGMLIERGMKMPPKGIRNPTLEQLRVEDVYEKLRKRKGKRKQDSQEKRTPGSGFRDLVCGVPKEEPGGSAVGPADGGEAEEKRRDAYWRTVLHRAALLQRQFDPHFGLERLNSSREVDAFLRPRLDWRTLLWRFMVRTPTDYRGWDRRFVHRGLYLDSLEGETLTVAVCIDTSGSISSELLQRFRSELGGIQAACPHLRIKLYFADVRLFGPWWLDPEEEFPAPMGGGGTDFRPFFDAIEDDGDGETSVDLVVYQTDGYGVFPTHEPEVPVLWCVPSDALKDESFPWGEVARLEAR